MRIELPPERTLPDKDERVARIVATASRGRRPVVRRWVAPVAASVAAATVIGLSLGFGGEDGRTGPTEPTPDLAATPTGDLAQPDVELWLRDLPAARAAAIATTCTGTIGRTVTIDPSEVLSAQVQRSLVRTSSRTAVVIAKDAETGETLGCDATVTPTGRLRAVEGVASMGGPGSKSAVNATDETHPAIPTDGPGGMSVGANGATFQVDERVASMRQRFVVDGEPGPWHVARAVHGYVYVQARVAESTLVGAHTLVLETQVLDHDGSLLDAPGDQKGGGGITDSPGTTRTDDRGWDLCSLATADPGPSTCSGG